MSLIPQLMSGRKLEHDLKFASDGPISGLVEGVQSADLSSHHLLNTTTLFLKETSAEGSLQMKASFLSLDPGGASKSVKLPAAITDGPDLAGRKIVIYNSADANGEDLTIFESDGTTFVARVGVGDFVEICFLAHGKPFCTNEVFYSQISIGNNADPQVVASAIGANYVMIPTEAFIAYGDDPDATTYLFEATNQSGSYANYAQLASTDFNADTVIRVPQFVDGLSATHSGFEFAANSNLRLHLGTAPAVTSGVCRIYYRVVLKDLSPLS